MDSGHNNDRTAAATRLGDGGAGRGVLLLALALFLLLPVYGAATAGEYPAGARFPTIVVYVGFG